MATVFEELRERFRKFARPGVGAQDLEQARRSLGRWLERNATELAGRKPPDEFNGTLLQDFHWYLPSDGDHWNGLRERARELAEAGFAAVWLPPASKASGGGADVGYAAYDLWDLGEFDQKGAVRTKYGTREQYVAAVRACQAAGLQVYADVVFNHKTGGDAMEEIEAVPVDPEDRLREIGPPETIRAWTAFTFPGRAGRHSAMQWHWRHFDSVDHNADRPGDRTIYRFKDKSFETKVDLRRGNYDFLMGCDLDLEHPEVRAELESWGRWMLDTVGVDGFRLDAIKHIGGDFFNGWLDAVERHAGRDLYAVGEYWSDDLATLHWYIGNTGGRLDLFDVPLHYNFHRASTAGGQYDMRTLLDGTLMRELPLHAVTFVDNHDTQPLQALESAVESWFKPLAYAVILLRRSGYPCVFHADYYGARYTDRGRDGREHSIGIESQRAILDRLLFARRHFAYGDELDWFDHPDLVGWSRTGTTLHPRALAVLLSDGPGGTKWMDVRRPHAIFDDLLEQVAEPVHTNADGWGEFRCAGGSVSVWVERREP